MGRLKLLSLPLNQLLQDELIKKGGWYAAFL
jgi:hypothetical protein